MCHWTGFLNDVIDYNISSIQSKSAHYVLYTKTDRSNKSLLGGQKITNMSLLS